MYARHHTAGPPSHVMHPSTHRGAAHGYVHRAGSASTPVYFTHSHYSTVETSSSAARPVLIPATGWRGRSRGGPLAPPREPERDTDKHSQTKRAPPAWPTGALIVIYIYACNKHNYICTREYSTRFSVSQLLADAGQCAGMMGARPVNTLAETPNTQ